MTSEILRAAIGELRAILDRIDPPIAGTPTAEGTAPVIIPKRTGKGIKRAIEAIDLKTGAVVQRFESQSDAGRAGFQLCLINKCLAGQVPQTGGFGWRFAAE